MANWPDRNGWGRQEDSGPGQAANGEEPAGVLPQRADEGDSKRAR